MNKRPLLVACDVYRPAIDQIGVLTDQVNVDLYKEIDNKNPVEIAKTLQPSKASGHNVVIVDTAGRRARRRLNDEGNYRS